MTDIRLYAILDPARCVGRALPDLARAAAKGGATILQYRDKASGTRELIENARTIRAALEGSGVPFLVNDRVDVALSAGADGVHVGQDDMAVEDARTLLGPDAVIGLTIKTAQHAEAAPIGLLDYVCIGGVHATASKENSAAIGVDGWSRLARHFRTHAPKLPVGAIAGIDETNAADLIRAGANGVAVISALFMADDVEAATRELRIIVEFA